MRLCTPAGTQGSLGPPLAHVNTCTVPGAQASRAAGCHVPAWLWALLQRGLREPARPSHTRMRTPYVEYDPCIMVQWLRHHVRYSTFRWMSLREQPCSLHPQRPPSQPGSCHLFQMPLCLPGRWADPLDGESAAPLLVLTTGQTGPLRPEQLALTRGTSAGFAVPDPR